MPRRILKCDLCGMEVESSELGKVWFHVFGCRGTFVHDRYENVEKDATTNSSPDPEDTNFWIVNDSTDDG